MKLNAAQRLTAASVEDQIAELDEIFGMSSQSTNRTNASYALKQSNKSDVTAVEKRLKAAGFKEMRPTAVQSQFKVRPGEFGTWVRKPLLVTFGWQSAFVETV